MSFWQPLLARICISPHSLCTYSLRHGSQGSFSAKKDSRWTPNYWNQKRFATEFLEKKILSSLNTYNFWVFTTQEKTPKTHTKKISHINKPCKLILDSLLPLCRDAASRIHRIAEHQQNTGTNMEKRSKLLAHNYSKFEKKLVKTVVSQQWMMLSVGCKVRV